MITGVIDYRAGNLRSIETALRYLGEKYFVSDDPEKLAKCDRLIFPGVGEASSAMKNLSESGIGGFLKEFSQTGKPLLGICLGCQIILEWSEEGNTTCLDMIEGNVRLFKSSSGLKVPQIGWNSVRITKPHYIFRDIPDNASFYFVHSYYPEVSEEYTIGVSEYGIEFSSAVAKENVCAVQFHPEKSGKHGLKLMENFLKGE